MTLKAELYWSFRSPYSYLATKRYRRIAEAENVAIAVRPVYPIAIRNPDFFKQINPLWVPYLLRDIKRLADFHGLPIAFPSPDPVVMDMVTREISPDQPHIFWLTRLGVEAERRGKGLAFIDEVSTLIWGGTVNWHEGDHLAGASQRAGLDLEAMRAAISGSEQSLDDEIAANQAALEKAGHWGVPTLVFKGEPFFGQDRIDVAVWRMRQARTGEQG